MPPIPPANSLFFILLSELLLFMTPGLLMLVGLLKDEDVSADGSLKVWILLADFEGDGEVVSLDMRFNVDLSMEAVPGR